MAHTPHPPGHPNPEPDVPEPADPGDELDIPTEDDRDGPEHAPGRT